MEFKQYFDNIPTGIMVADKRGKIVYINKHMVKMLGLNSGKIKNKKISELIPERYRENHSKYMKEYFKNIVKESYKKKFMFLLKKPFRKG